MIRARLPITDFRLVGCRFTFFILSPKRLVSGLRRSARGLLRGSSFWLRLLQHVVANTFFSRVDRRHGGGGGGSSSVWLSEEQEAIRTNGSIIDWLASGADSTLFDLHAVESSISFMAD